jgi:hypothetical protein
MRRRHRVFIAKAKRARQATSITGSGATVSTLKVPAGIYTVQGMVNVSNSVSYLNVVCELRDSSGVLNNNSFPAQWITAETPATSSLSMIGLATYSAQTTVTIVCYAMQGSATSFDGTIVAEQVSYDTAS